MTLEKVSWPRLRVKIEKPLQSDDGAGAGCVRTTVAESDVLHPFKMGSSSVARKRVYTVSALR